VPAAQLPRQIGDVMVAPWVREALVRLNPETVAHPDRADEVVYNLRACILSVQGDLKRNNWIIRTVSELTTNRGGTP
jgi:type I restriction enzyme R subunit